MPSVIWITGLSGSGKTTLASGLVQKLISHNLPVIRLDGDELRHIFGVSATDQKIHTRSARLSLARQYSRLCQSLSNQGFIVVIATISMFEEIYSWNRQNLPNYLEIYLKVPIDELRLRDPKGIYMRYDSGQLKNVAGLDLEVEEPSSPDILWDFSLKNAWDLLPERVTELVMKNFN